ncbi:MAG: site-specific DNA-methyltransferase [Verrucomicrobiaceae bacterium]|nr:MAG: site-specific DNA-methyltransferase [Verrucomicrobiaceae bacterium]
MTSKARAPRNRTLFLSDEDRGRLRPQLRNVAHCEPIEPNCVINANSLKLAKCLTPSSVDLLFLDPPYNLTKSYNGTKFYKKAVSEYTEWLDEMIGSFVSLLKPTASVYICGDWLSSASIYPVASKHFTIRNRITWEREKGRGASANWKNASEDIWFCTVSDNYFFDVSAVKLRRRVIAPYRKEDGTPKDWSATETGAFRDTHPSNMWTDITIPFWSMPENTDHPTQKSEKLLAKILLASSRPGNLILDPFAGSGTTCVVAKKLGRRFIGVELDEEYALLALRRLELAGEDQSIQGYTQGVFWERNTMAKQSELREDSRLQDSYSGADLFQSE